MSVRKITALALSAVAIALIAGPATAQAAHFEGTVTAKNKTARTFTLTQHEGGGRFKFKVTKATKYERIAGFAAIKVGAVNIEVVARRGRNGRWIATKVEPSGKSGGSGGKDDGPNHS